jgi:Na+(H+)/acetate symporter ActP
MDSAAALAVALVAVATIGVGALSLRLSRTTDDFYVASRTVTPLWNASAIGGEYLSAASYLGIAGLILAYGVDMLWYPIGYTAGYLALLVLVAAPLRRSGAYTLPDFAQDRLRSIPVRRASSVLVVVIGWLYLVPQLQGAGLTLVTSAGAPTWAGGLVVCGVVLVSVLFGGMRSITFAQAFQFWLKLTALLVPVAFLLLAWHSDGSPHSAGDQPPTARRTTVVRLTATTAVNVSTPATYTVVGLVDGRAVDGRVSLADGRHELGKGTVVTLHAGDPVPVITSLPVTTAHTWATPLHAGRDHPLFATYSLVLATFLGTMGLPHVLVRFYTNPDGRRTRRTALAVVSLLSAFYLLPTIYGALGRLYAPDLLLTGDTDAAVLLLPERLVGGSLGHALAALVTAGAFAAFLSTSSGLTISVAGVIAQDVLPSRRRPVRAFRIGCAAAVLVPYLLSLGTQRISVAAAVGLAFAVAASSFCPLLVLGIWWRGLTDVGALAGLTIGGGLAGTAVVVTAIIGPQPGWVGALLEQPAALTVPIAFAVMIIGSLLTRDRRPAAVARIMVRLHAPESLFSPSADVSAATSSATDDDRSSRRTDRSPTTPTPSVDPIDPVTAPPRL